MRSFSRSLGTPDPVAALEARFAPQLEAYARLRAALAEHRAIEAASGWPPVAAGATLRAGDRDARVAALRTRLCASGDDAAPIPADPALFDASLELAVITFETRHGLEPDGAVGRRTLAALNVDVAARIDQIRVNLDRLRRVAQDPRATTWRPCAARSRAAKPGSCRSAGRCWCWCWCWCWSSTTPSRSMTAAR